MSMATSAVRHLQAAQQRVPLYMTALLHMTDAADDFLLPPKRAPFFNFNNQYLTSQICACLRRPASWHISCQQIHELTKEIAHAQRNDSGLL